MYSTFSHCSQETFSTENVLTGRGPHRRLEHLLTDRAVEIIFRVGRGRRKFLGHGEGWAGEATAPAGAEVVVVVVEVGGFVWPGLEAARVVRADCGERRAGA